MVATAVEAVLRASGRDVEVTGRKARLRCPNPEHVTRSAAEGGTASFYVQLDGPWAGNGKCYGCGLRAKWPQVVALLGLPRSARFMPMDAGGDLFTDEMAERMLGGSTGDDAVEMRATMPWPVNRPWRDVPGRLVSLVGGGLVGGKRGATRLRLPSTVRGKYVGRIDCTLDKPLGDEWAYDFSPGPWVKHTLYPYDFVRQRRPRVVILEEGARDALVTIRNGAMALAALGSENWSERCRDLLLQVGAACVVIMTDPDEAGEHLMHDVHRDVSPHVDTRCVVLPSEVRDGRRRKIYDPADLRRDQLERVLARVGVVKGRDGCYEARRRS